MSDKVIPIDDTLIENRNSNSASEGTKSGFLRSPGPESSSNFDNSSDINNNDDNDEKKKEPKSGGGGGGDKPRRQSTTFKGERIVRKTLNESPEERLLRKKQEAKIVRYREGKERSRRESSSKESLSDFVPPKREKEKETLEERLARKEVEMEAKELIEIPLQKWENLVKKRLVRREGFHCLFNVITSEESEKGVHDIMKYFRGDDTNFVSPFDKFKWMERFLMTLCVLENTMEKKDRKELGGALEATCLKEIKYEDATILANQLQLSLRNNWTARGAVKEWRTKYAILDEFGNEYAWFVVLITCMCGYLKTQLRMRHNGVVKFILCCALVVAGCNDMCPGDCQRKWWWDSFGIGEDPYAGAPDVGEQ